MIFFFLTKYTQKKKIRQLFKKFSHETVRNIRPDHNDKLSSENRDCPDHIVNRVINEVLGMSFKQMYFITF